MSLLHTDPGPIGTDGNTTAVTTAVTTFINDSTPTPGYSDYVDRITANDITSRTIYAYSFLSALGFVAACLLLLVAFRAQRKMAWLLCAFSVLQLLLLLLSLYATVHRPSFLRTSGLGCATLSFTINAVHGGSVLVLVVLAYILSLDPPSHALLRKPRVCAAVVILGSVVVSLVLAAIGGKREDNGCFMDPVSLPYALAKLILALLVPYMIQVTLLIAGCVRQWKTKGRFLSGSEEGPVFVAVSFVLFVCGLLYGTALIRAALLKRGDRLVPKEEAFLNVFEFVFFSGSSFSLILVLMLHRPCRETLKTLMRQMRDCCKRPGQTQAHRITAPHIEISNDLQFTEQQ